jgi:hypothetical protein
VRHRLILEEEIVEATLSVHRFGRVEKFIQEVLWRTYWKGWLEAHPGAWKAWRQRLGWLRQNAAPGILRRAEEVAAGRSGVGVMDGFARELIETGYLHNHARMWWASFWIHVERLPWELGADVFFRRLLDADPASNTLSWRWVAGAQTRGKMYLVRRSNLERYCTPERLDPAGLERLDDHRVSAAPPPEEPSFPRQAVAAIPTTFDATNERVGIWIHADDGCAEAGPLSALRPISVAAFTDRSAYRHYGLNEKRTAHLDAVLADAVHRAAVHFRCPAELGDAESLSCAIARWAGTRQVKQVVALAPFAGPVNDALPALRDRLASAGASLILVRREWDAQLFEFAHAGFFPFWEKAHRWIEQRFPASER